ncbi:MAG TPA: AmmeMemoRadiSam system protein B [Candidatus Acidoferrum sp.]
MLRLPAVAGRFYPADAQELTSLIRNYAQPEPQLQAISARACLVPHAGYMYSGHVAGAVFARVALPKKIIGLGVRHYPRGEPAAILSSGAWRTPLGDAPVDEEIAGALRRECPLLREDSVAHSTEHSLEVQVPFLQALASGFSFVPVALGTVQFESLVSIGEGIARVLGSSKDNVLLLTTSDLNHYEDDATTRVKDHKAIDRLLALDARGLYDTCRNEEISMCGLGPAVAMLTALQALGAKKAELVKYATSADVSGERSQVVGYAGMIFS